VAGRPAVQADGLALFDVVLDVDVGAVAGVKPGELADAGVDGDQLVAPPEFLLRLGGAGEVARVQRFVTDEDP